MKNRHVSVSELTRVSFQIDTCRLLIRHIAVWGLLGFFVRLTLRSKSLTRIDGMVFGIRPPTHSAVWYDARCHVLVEYVHAVGQLHDGDTLSVAHGIAINEPVLLDLADEESTRAWD